MRWGGSIESSILKPQKVTMWLWSYRIYFCPIGSTIHFPLQLTHESKTFWKSFAVKGTLCTFGSCIDGSFFFFFFFHRKVTCKGKDELQTKSLEKWYWKTLRTHNKNICWNPININRWNNKLLLTEKKSRCSVVHFLGVTYIELTFPGVAPEFTRDYLVLKSSIH